MTAELHDTRIRHSKVAFPSIAKTSLKQKEKTLIGRCFVDARWSGIRYAIAWVAYVLLGSWIFIVLEQTSTTITVEHSKWSRFKDLVNVGQVVDELHSLREDLQRLCPHKILHSPFDELISGNTVTSFAESENSTTKTILLQPIAAANWISKADRVCQKSLTVLEVITNRNIKSMVDAIYFTMTLVTTIGFGYIYPTTRGGRMFCIVYALIGVPLTCILMAKNSEMLSNRMLKLYERAKKRHKKNPKTVLYAVTWVFLSAGFIVFMFLPSVVFVYVEDWTYENSLYFTFITLTTIGFGDLVAGYSTEYSYYTDIYKMGVVVWIMLALGYWILLLNFLQKAIKSNAKTLKRTFTAKKIAKQAEFIKQIMTKVKNDDGDTASAEEKLHMMALMVESLSRKGSLILPSESPSCLFVPARVCPIEEMDETTEDVKPKEATEKDAEAEVILPETADRKFNLPFSFDDLLNVDVKVKTDSLPNFDSLITHSVNDPSVELDLKEPIKNINSGMKTLNLPLRDVLGLVLLVASLEEGNEFLSECDTPSEDSDHSSEAFLNNRKESVPLLRSIFLNSKDRRPTFTGSDRNLPSSSFVDTTLVPYLDDYEEDEQDGSFTKIESMTRNAAMVV